MKLAAYLSLLFCFCSSALIQSRVTQLREHHEIFDSLRSSATTAKEQLEAVELSKAQRSKVQELSESIVANIEQLDAIAHSRKTARISAEYLESLKLDSELLNYTSSNLSQGKDGADKAVTALNEVAEDLKTKVIFSQNQMGTGLRLVEFIVHTKKDETELGGYEVWYVPRGWSDTPDKFRRSDRTSSPAIMKLAPGNYLVWLKKGQLVTEKTGYTLGLEGSRKEIDFPIP